MPRRFFSLLALPMLFLAQCAPSGCAPAPGLGNGVVISIGQMQRQILAVRLEETRRRRGGAA